jgi:hypothetical protein
VPERENIRQILGKIDGLWGDRLLEMFGPDETLVAGGMAVLPGDNLTSAFFCTNERVIQMAERMTGKDTDSLLMLRTSCANIDGTTRSWETAQYGRRFSNRSRN